MILKSVLVPCRKRKMRCVPRKGDLQKRCANCIKRSKECVFRPVGEDIIAANGAQSEKINAPSSSHAQDIHLRPEQTSSGVQD